MDLAVQTVLQMFQHFAESIRVRRRRAELQSCPAQSRVEDFALAMSGLLQALAKAENFAVTLADSFGGLKKAAT